MKVQEIIIEKQGQPLKGRYVLIDSNGQIVIPVVKYLKYLYNTGKSSNTGLTP